MTEWELHGMEFGNGNCSYACPCPFNYAHWCELHFNQHGRIR